MALTAEQIAEAIEKAGFPEIIDVVLDALPDSGNESVQVDDIVQNLPESLSEEDTAAVLNAIESAAGENDAPLHGRFQDAMYMNMPQVDLGTGKEMGSGMSDQTGGNVAMTGGLENTDLSAEDAFLEDDDSVPMMAMMMNMTPTDSLPVISLPLTFEFRAINGEGNNPNNPLLGVSHEDYMTVTGYQYGDGVSTPNDLNRPNVRDVSNAIFSQDGDVFNTEGLSNYLWVWGQFLDHDINLTREGHGEDYAINVPRGDIYFDPMHSGTQTISFTRSGYNENSGTDADNPRTQVNEITAFIDASNVYGSTAEAEALLRGEGGYLRVSDGDLLPVGMGDRGPEFKAGDVRANENAGLTSMHTIFMREHNRLVDEVSTRNPDMDAEQLYQTAKMIVEAEIQHITYNEFLSTLLGENAFSTYQGYDVNVDPQIATEFASAAFRVGHTMLSSDIFRMQENGDESAFGHLTLQNAFFRPDIIMREGGVDEILRGIGSSFAQQIDGSIIDDVRNFLFGPPGAGGFDLVSLNIQRGRDHGIPDFNTTREAYGLDPVESFDDLVDDADLVQRLTDLYGDIAHLDLWVGGLLEDSFGDALVGETFFTIIADQFTRLRDGDRFWYEERFDGELLDFIQSTTLSDVILRNTDIDYLQDDVFAAANRIGGDELDNVIDGTNDADLLIGFGGNDVLSGGLGADTLYGGEGSDVFVFDAIDGLADSIKDFALGEDQIDISDVLIGYDSASDALEDFVSFVQNGDQTQMFVDADGAENVHSAELLAIIDGLSGPFDALDILITDQNFV